MKKRKKHRIAFIIIAILFIYMSLNYWASSNWLAVNIYTYQTEAPLASELRLVVLADLHEHEFGENNAKLIENVQEQTPDLILLDGDFINEDSTDPEKVCSLIEGLVPVAPVCYALGNHEMDYIKMHGDTLIKELRAAGAVVLDKSYIDMEIDGTKVRIGGMYDYAFGADGNDSAEAASEDVRSFLEDFQDMDELKIMMAHRPDSFIFGNASSYWDIDLVISGHNHGGQIKIPFCGGLYGGDQGWFPEYVHGMYEKGNMHIFVTSGLGSYGEVLPRLWNRPEIAVMEIK